MKGKKTKQNKTTKSDVQAPETERVPREVTGQSRLQADGDPDRCSLGEQLLLPFELGYLSQEDGWRKMDREDRITVQQRWDAETRLPSSNPDPAT